MNPLCRFRGQVVEWIDTYSPQYSDGKPRLDRGTLVLYPDGTPVEFQSTAGVMLLVWQYPLHNMVWVLKSLLTLTDK